MKKILFFLCSFFLFQGTSQANRDDIANVTYATDLKAPYTVQVKVKNLACGTSKNYSGDIFALLGTPSTRFPVCYKTQDRFQCSYTQPTRLGVSGTLDTSMKVYATNRQILQELGVPSQVSSQIKGIYQQNISFMMWLITDSTGRNTGSPFQVNLGTYELLGGDNTITYSDKSECGHAEPPRCGSANKAYDYKTDDWSINDLFCDNSTPDPTSPAFPLPGGSTTWKCGTGTGAVNCKATRGSAGSNPSCGTAHKRVFPYDQTDWNVTMNRGSVGGALSLCTQGNPTSVGYPSPGKTVYWKCISGSNSVDCTASREKRFDNSKKAPVLESVQIEGCKQDTTGKYFCMSDQDKLTLKIKFSEIGEYGQPPRSDLIELDINNANNTSPIGKMSNDTDIFDTSEHSLNFAGNASLDFRKVGNYTFEVFALGDQRIIASKSNIIPIKVEIIPNNNVVFSPLPLSTNVVKGIYNASYESVDVCGTLKDSNGNLLLHLPRTVKVNLIGQGIDLNQLNTVWDGEAVKTTQSAFDHNTSKYCFKVGSYAPGHKSLTFQVEVNKHTDFYRLDTSNFYSKNIATGNIHFKKPLSGKMMSSFDGGATYGTDIKLGKPTLYKILPQENIAFSIMLQGATKDNIFPSESDLIFEKIPTVTLPTVDVVLLKKKTSPKTFMDTGIQVLDTLASKKTPLKISYTLDGKNIAYYFSSFDSFGDLTPIDLIKNQDNPALVSTGIAVTGLKNKDEATTTTSKGSKASVMIGENLTRYDLLTTFKKNVALKSNGVTWCKGDRTITNLNNDLVGCTVTVAGEKISFIEGNVTLGNGTGSMILNANMKRSLIVKNGSTYISSNISTYNKANAQLLIGTYNELALKSSALPANLTIDKNASEYAGWTFIKPTVTNIDAYVVSQGPVVSYDGMLYAKQSTPSPVLKYQLHIYGSLLSLNTNGASENLGITYRCPYMVTNCTSQNNFASIFDLVFLRHSNAVISPANPVLRPVKDPDYKDFPLFIERDAGWSSSPSVLFSQN